MSHKQAKAERQAGKQVIGVITVAVHTDGNISLNSPLGVKETMLFLLQAVSALVSQKVMDMPRQSDILAPNDLEKASRN